MSIFYILVSYFACLQLRNKCCFYRTNFDVEIELDGRSIRLPRIPPLEPTCPKANLCPVGISHMESNREDSGGDTHEKEVLTSTLAQHVQTRVRGVIAAGLGAGTGTGAGEVRPSRNETSLTPSDTSLIHWCGLVINSKTLEV